MGCGALSSMPCGRTSINHCHVAVSTRKPSKGGLGQGRSFCDEGTADRAYGARLSGQAWQQDTALPLTACADVEEHAAAKANSVGSASSGTSTRIESANGFGCESSCSSSSAVVAVAQTQASTSRHVRGFGGSSAGKVEEDTDWEPPPSGTLLKCESSSARRAPTRIRASPLGALSTPLVPRGDSSSASATLQAETLRPAVVGETWPQADDNDPGVELRSTSASLSASSRSPRTPSPTPLATVAVAAARAPPLAGPRIANGAIASAGVANVDSCGDCGAASVDASTAPTHTFAGAAGNSAMRKCSSSSALSGASTAVEESRETEEGSIRDTVTVCESETAAADESVAHEPLGVDMSEDPSESVSGIGVGSDGSVHSVGAEAGTDLEFMQFMLERPFLGLETILEDDDFDQSASPSRVSKSPSVQTRVSCSGSRLRGQPGPLGIPGSFFAEMLKPLNSPVPPSAEKMWPTLSHVSSGQASSSTCCSAHQEPQGSLGELDPQEMSPATTVVACPAATNSAATDCQSSRSDSQ